MAMAAVTAKATIMYTNRLENNMREQQQDSSPNLAMQARVGVINARQLQAHTG